MADVQAPPPDLMDDIPVELAQESTISRMLTEKTIKIVIIVVLYLLFLLPLTSMETWDNPYTVHEHAVDMLVYLYDNEGMNAFNKSLTIYLNGV
jgi:hypothetical protein